MAHEENKLFPPDIEPEKKKELQLSGPSDHLPTIMEKIQEQFYQKKFCNVTLISGVDHHKVEAHKQVLAAGSPYFDAMFGGSMREAVENEVTLTKINGISLEKIVIYIYTSTINLSTDIAEDVIIAAKFFQLDSLVILCSDFIAQHLELSNCLAFAQFADNYKFDKLYDLAEDFICLHFLKLRKLDEFFELTVEQLTNYIASDELRLPSEEEVFETIMLWVEYDRQDREKYIGELFQYIRFPYLGPTFIVSDVEPVCESPKAYGLLYKALKWHYMPNLRYTLQIFTHKHEESRNYMESIIAINGWDKTDRYLRVGLHYNEEREWKYKKWPSQRKLRTKCGYATLNGHLIIAGGMLLTGEATDSVECMDLKTLQWSTLPPMRSKRHSFVLITLNEQLYAVGGENRQNVYLRAIDMYNPKTNQWQNVAPMREWSGSKFYCSAGANVICVSNRQRSVYSYDTTAYEHSIYHVNTGQWWESWLSTSGDIVGTGIWTFKRKDYLVVAVRDSIKLYSLADKKCTTLDQGDIKQKYTNCKLFGDRLIFYGTNAFAEFNLMAETWKPIPVLNNQLGKVAVIFH